MLYEGGSHSTLVGGTGTDDILIDGGADNSLVAGHSNTLIEVAMVPGTALALRWMVAPSTP